MKQIWLPAMVLLMSASIVGCAAVDNIGASANAAPVPEEIRQEADTKHEEEAVKRLVEDFGSKLQLVSLLAPQDVVSKSLQEHYGGFITPALLAKWQNDPQNAPGRLTSSPWPDRIDVQSVARAADGAFRVQGEIVEITSADKESGKSSGKRPVTLDVRKQENRFLIDAVTLGDVEAGNEEAADSVSYENAEYGFRFALTEGWRGYTIVSGQWEGDVLENGQPVLGAVKGPMISIRHPLWTEEKPRQDIPILIFTLDQWDSLQEGKFHIGAAPINPSELGRNNKYVFALPARYNFAFPEGFEEVEKMLETKPLQPISR